MSSTDIKFLKIIIELIIFIAIMIIGPQKFQKKKQVKKYNKIIDGDKWNYMIDLWVDNKLNNPIAHLITYDSEINNGGHLHFFENCHDDLPEIIPIIKTFLSKKMAKNLQDAYDLYQKLNLNIDSVETFVEQAKEDHFEKFDNYYYQNDAEVSKVLNEYSLTLTIKK